MSKLPRVVGCFERVPSISMDSEANYALPRHGFLPSRELTDAKIARYWREGRYGRSHKPPPKPA